MDSTSSSDDAIKIGRGDTSSDTLTEEVEEKTEYTEEEMTNEEATYDSDYDEDEDSGLSSSDDEFASQEQGTKKKRDLSLCPPPSLPQPPFSLCYSLPLLNSILHVSSSSA